MSCVRLVCCVELLCKWGLVSSGNLALGHPIPYSLFPSNMPHVLFVCTCAFLAVRPRDVKANGVADRWHIPHYVLVEFLSTSSSRELHAPPVRRSDGPLLPSASRCPGGAVCHLATCHAQQTREHNPPDRYVPASMSAYEKLVGRG